MGVRRAPLFSFGLAFASGCLLGLDGLLGLRPVLVLWLIAGLAWLFLFQRARASLVAFFVFALLSGNAHTLLLSSTLAGDDLRLLPPEKAFATTQWRGRVIEEPSTTVAAHPTQRSLDHTTFVLEVEAWRSTEGRLFNSSIDEPWRSAEGRMRCTIQGPASEIEVGDRIECAAALEDIPLPLDPGQLDVRDLEARQGIYYDATIAPLNWRRIEAGANWWRTLSFHARDWADARLRLGLEDDPRTADFLAGMLIGYRQDIPIEIEQDFRRTGTLHVFAVSGQNIAEMVVVAIILLQLFGLVRWRWAWTLLPVVLLYCLLTGSPASAVRATIMAVVVLSAWRLGRPLNALGCWAIAFLAMLIWNPPILLDAGAQLSFAVVLGLILIAPPLWGWLKLPFHPDPFLPGALLSNAQKREEWCWSRLLLLLATAVAAEMVSDPITMVSFHQITPVSVLANLIVVPTAGLITMIGTLSLVLSLVSSPLAALLNNANWLIARGLILFVGFLAHRPGASINVPDLRTLSQTDPTIIVAPVQDAACLFIRTPTQTWLVNTGREYPARTQTDRLLQFYGVNRLDGLILAQMSTADISGALLTINDFHPRRLILPALATRSPIEKIIPPLLSASGGKLERWEAGQVCEIGPETRLTILRPAADTRETTAQDRALVFLIQVGDQSLLWAGKMTERGRQALSVSYPNLQADLLVSGVELPPSTDWLQSLHVREWLEIPVRDAKLNVVMPQPELPPGCRAWPLAQTGAVTIHFVPGKDAQPAQILLSPWAANPP